jgi:excisionase family DNA binding protein
LERLLSVGELAEYLGVRPATIYKRSRVPGAIPCIRIGTLLRFPESEIVEWVKGRAAEPVKRGA